VCAAVSPDLVGFVESAGLATTAYQLDTQAVIEKYLQLWRYFYFSRNLWRIRDLMRLRRELVKIGLQSFWDTSTTLMSLADGADLLLTGSNFEQPAANVAEHYDIPLAAMHFPPHGPMAKSFLSCRHH